MTTCLQFYYFFVPFRESKPIPKVEEILLRKRKKKSIIHANNLKDKIKQRGVSEHVMEQSADYLNRERSEPMDPSSSVLRVLSKRRGK